MTDQIPINQMALTSSEEDIPYQLSGDPNSQPRMKAAEDPNKAKAPPHFITRVYLISCCMLLFSVAQWSLMAHLDVVKQLIVLNSEWLLLFFWVSFLQLLVLIFFYDNIIAWSKAFWYVMVLSAVQTSSTVLALPLITAFQGTMPIIYSGLAVIIIVLVCILFSTFKKLQIEHAPDYVIVGGIRIYMLCSVGNLISQTTSLSPYLEVIIAIIIIPFITCFILVCAKTIGTIEFYKKHGHRIPLCALSSYYCYLPLVANILTFFLNIKLVLQTKV